MTTQSLFLHEWWQFGEDARLLARSQAAYDFPTSDSEDVIVCIAGQILEEPMPGSRPKGESHMDPLASVQMTIALPVSGTLQQQPAAPSRGRRPRSNRRATNVNYQQARAAESGPRGSAWLLRLLLLVASRPWTSRADMDNKGTSYFRGGGGFTGGTGTSSTSSTSYSEQVITSDLPQQMISGTCIASEPQRDCGLHQWESLSCPQLLGSYEFDPNSTCCSFQDLTSGSGGSQGCSLTVGGAGNTCTWREPGSSNRYFTVMIMDQSTSACPPTQYEIPMVTKSPAPSNRPSYEPSQAPSSLDTIEYDSSESPSTVPSFASPPLEDEGDIPLAPIPSPAMAPPVSPRQPSSKPDKRTESTIITKTRGPYHSPTRTADTLSPYGATGEATTDDDDKVDIPEAPTPAPAGPDRTIRPTTSKPLATSLPAHPYQEQQEMTRRQSGSCWATEPTPECGLLQLPTVTCTDLLQAYEWSGTCCSFRDTPNNNGGERGGGCSLTVDGPKAHCTWKQKRDGGDEYTMYISEMSTSTCPPSKYTVPVGPPVDGWDGPTPVPKRATGSCWTTSPNEECGFYTWSDPCSEVAEAYQWEGSCCSLSDTDSGGCRLTVDGPGSQCTFVDATSEYTIFVSEEADGTCPESTYDVGAKDADITYQSPTPEPITSGYCATTYPDDSCGMYSWGESCGSLLSQYEFTGTCCSFKPTESGGCRLVVDGPGSTCTWKEKGKESYFSVEIDDRNDRSCPESTVSALSGTAPPSPFTECVGQAFSDCLTTCERYPTLRQSFKACTRTDSTEAIQCAAGAAYLCLETNGKAPMVICQQLSNMVASGALHSDSCLALQGKCSAQTNVCA